MQDPAVNTYSVVIHPQVFSTASGQKQTLTVNRSRYTQATIGMNHSSESIDDVPSRSRGQPWEYLLRQNPGGQLVCARRGKLLVIAAGPHALLIHFGLEAHLVACSRRDYDDLVREDVPGPNEDPEKSQLLRSFVMPRRFVEPSSRNSDQPRFINIFAAFISTEKAFMIVDFSRLVRLHIISRDRPWTPSDMEPSSSEWFSLWERFKGGPDWVLERDLAEEHLMSWRKDVVSEYERYMTLHKKWESLTKTRTLDSYFIRQRFGDREHQAAVDNASIRLQHQHPPRPEPRRRLLLKDMSMNSHRAFSGLGRHCINDILHFLGFHPGITSYAVCLQDDLFDHLKLTIYWFLQRFLKTSFLKRVATKPNTNNPFSFNAESNKNYISCYIAVFRRTRVKMPKELYDRYQSLGLLDPSHTIGDEYPTEKCKPCSGETKWVPVSFCGAPLKAYTVIVAKPPTPDYIAADLSQVPKDIAEFSYSTTIGCAQFHEHVMNQPDLLKIQSLIPPKGGSLKKEKTGKRGRPQKVPTKKSMAETSKRRKVSTSGLGVTFPDEDEGELEDSEDEATVVALAADYEAQQNSALDQAVERQLQEDHAETEAASRALEDSSSSTNGSSGHPLRIPKSQETPTQRLWRIWGQRNNEEIFPVEGGGLSIESPKLPALARNRTSRPGYPPTTRKGGSLSTATTLQQRPLARRRFRPVRHET
ncbi:hypothetical protein H0H93_007135 [Arthromyces matolae]|nr:hypothetical protein H0H93_007135 [Arthromyces matolae]